MIKNYIIIYYLLINIPQIYCIWPPPYKINLTHDAIYIISDPIEKNETQDVYDEDEMIADEKPNKLKVAVSQDKYYRLHRSIKYNHKFNTNQNDERIKKNKVYEEFNPDKEYFEPFKAGFINENNDFSDNNDIIYFDTITHITPNLQKIKKRGDAEESTEENYDYAQLKAEFNVELKQDALKNETLNYTNVKEDETLKDSLITLVGVENTKNCTEEEMKGIGLAAIKCIWFDLNKPKFKNQIFERVFRITVIWILIYLIIAIPCFCQYGWCCCCFRCKYCRPQEEIEEIKRFFAQNPPGIYHDEKSGQVFKYEPTRYEKYSQKALENELRKL